MKGNIVSDHQIKIKCRYFWALISFDHFIRVFFFRSESTSSQQAFHHTYVMKLFDRSVDLARFEEDTPLYPICRAWMANQPRNPQLIVK